MSGTLKPEFHEGDYVIYVCGQRFDIGIENRSL